MQQCLKKMKKRRELNLLKKKIRGLKMNQINNWKMRSFKNKFKL